MNSLFIGRASSLRILQPRNEPLRFGVFKLWYRPAVPRFPVRPAGEMLMLQSYTAQYRIEARFNFYSGGCIHLCPA